MRSLPILVLAAFAGLLLLPAGAGAAVDDTLLVSRVGLDGAPADNTSSFNIDVQTATPSISGDGGRVAFVTQAGNLGSGPGLYVKDMTSGTLTFVSALTTPTGSGASPGALLMQQPRLADSGQFVCYIDFVGTTLHAFVRNLSTAATTDAGPAFLGSLDFHDNDDQRKFCDVSDDGNRIAYVTDVSHDAADTESPPPPGTANDPSLDVYVHDVSANTDTLASRADGAAGADGNGYSAGPEITPDGRFVVFRSRAASLSAENDDTVSNIYQRDLQTGTTRWVSRADGAAGGPGTASTLNNGVNLTSGSADAAQSNDGRYVAFESTQRDLDPAVPAVGTAAVYVRDLQAGTTHAAAVTRDATTGKAVALSGNSNLPTISADGRFVGLGSNGTALDPTSVTPTTGNIEKEFIRDTTSNRTALVSRGSGLLGAVNNGQASGAQISANGRFEVFASVATNLVPGDFSGPPTSFGGPTGVDIFVRELDPDRPLVADLPGAPKVSTPVLSTTLPSATTTVEAFTTPTLVTSLIGAKAAAAPATTSRSAPRAPKAVSVKLGEYGLLTLAVVRVKPGRLAHRKCLAAASPPRAKNKRCDRVSLVASKSLAGYEGANTFALSTVLGSRRLSAGSYRLRAIEYDLGLKIGERTRTFTIK